MYIVGTESRTALTYGWEMVMIRTSVLVMCVLAACATAVAAAPGFVVVCPINGMIDDGVSVLVERAVRESEGAKALIFVVDTPGGLLDSGIEITKTILKAPCRTIAYAVGMGAISAGALISYACDDLIMAPEANIGAATPVLMSAEGMQPTSEKEVSYMRAKMRALAEARGHNPAIAEAMVDKDIELRARTDASGKLVVFGITHGEESDAQVEDIARTVTAAVDQAVEKLPDELDGIKRAVKEAMPAPAEQAAATAPAASTEGSELILAAGKLLTLTPQEAIRYGVIPATASSLNEVMAYYGYAGLEQREIVPTWAEIVFRWLSNPMVSGILLMLGIGGIYMEIKTPGFGMFGIIGITCLSLFFGAHIILGVAEWIDVLLVALGFGLLMLEIFVLPGFGIAGISGICCLALGLYLSLTKVTIPEYSWDYERLASAAKAMGTTLASLLAAGYVVWRVFPHTPLFRWLVLTSTQQPEEGYVIQTSGDAAAAVGLSGVATTMLRPAGRGRFGDKTYSVVTRGEYLSKDTAIRIIKAEGNRYVVEQLPEMTQHN